MSVKQQYPVNPDRNVPWNTLPDLPLDPEVWETISVYKQLAKAKEAIGKLQGRSIALPDPSVLITIITLQESRDSSAIENIFTTNDELFQAYTQSAKEPVKGPAKEVLYYREAMWEGINFIEKNQKFTREYFVNLYRIVKNTNDGIRPPVAKVYISKSGSLQSFQKETLYTPPRGEGIVEEKLDNLASFVNDDERYNIDPLLKMAMAHFQFEAIHPFRDGNGRVGRLFNIHLLIQKKVLDYPILYLSKFLIEQRQRYYDGLAGVSQRGDWQEWILFLLSALEHTAEFSYQLLNQLVEMKQDILEYIRQKTSIRNPDQLVDMIFSNPYTKVAHFVDNHIYAEKTARDYLNELTELGILEKKVIRGHHYYLNSELYRLIEEV